MRIAFLARILEHFIPFGHGIHQGRAVQVSQRGGLDLMTIVQ